MLKRMENQIILQALVQNGSGDKDLVNFSTEIVITIFDARVEMDDCYAIVFTFAFSIKIL